MKQPDANKLAEHYAAILQEIGADIHSEGIRAAIAKRRLENPGRATLAPRRD